MSRCLFADFVGMTQELVVVDEVRTGVLVLVLVLAPVLMRVLTRILVLVDNRVLVLVAIREQ
jgi:hypothetical protein